MFIGLGLSITSTIRRIIKQISLTSPADGEILTSPIDGEILTGAE